MEKFLRLIINRLGVVLIISIVFLSISQQKFISKYTVPVICSETLTATYPKLNFSTYFGGSDRGDRGNGIAVSNDGSCYVTGYTWSNDFITKNAFDNTLGATSDAFVVKFVDTPITSIHLSTVNGFLVFIAVMPIIALILYKKRK